MMNGLGKKIYLETFGCQMNVLDSELIEGQLRSLGFDFTTNCDDADVVLYNTCSVRELAENKVLSRLGRLKIRKQTDKDLVVGVVGCMAERDGLRMLKRMEHVDLLCGPSELDKLPSLLNNVLLTGRQQAALSGDTARRSSTLAAAETDGLELLDLSRSFSPEKNRYQAYVRLVRGCNKFCTYCVVPYTRGPEISRDPDAIISEARKLVEAGALEVTLLGQTVNHYKYEESAVSAPGGPVKKVTSFAELLVRLHDALPQLPRLRFLTSYPADFGQDILDAMAACPRICRYLHIPAQSGSNRILKLMNRGYTVESYLKLLEDARHTLPGVAFAGDFIVGFPTETDADYEQTRQLVQAARYKNAFIFKYSPRPGTVAIRRYEDDVPDATKRYRNNDLLSLQNEISQELNRSLIGATVEVLCEGPSGWRGSDSIVAGAAAVAAGERPVELGSRLAAAINGKDMSSGAGKKTPSEVQLTGRTAADQIVVFAGTPRLEGQMVCVRVQAAHGMTIFGSLLADQMDLEDGIIGQGQAAATGVGR
ncbi:MAG: tRNA (N6-isopentenyl adenosine(37)-C2)-methylthiotransferase MiaB [Phycisphaerae bacterium]